MSRHQFKSVTLDGEEVVVHGNTGAIFGSQSDDMAVVLTVEQARGLARFVTEAVDDTKDARDTLRAKCYVMCRELGMTDKDRHELSIMVVGAERSPSWAQMTYAEIQRVADYLAGFGFVATILRDRAGIAGVRVRMANQAREKR